MTVGEEQIRPDQKQMVEVMTCSCKQSTISVACISKVCTLPNLAHLTDFHRAQLTYSNLAGSCLGDHANGVGTTEARIGLLADGCCAGVVRPLR